MPVVYRDHVRPQYHDWIIEGFAKYKDHPATVAGFKVAEGLLNYEAPTGPNVFGHHLDRARVMRELRDSGITPEALMCRVAEYAAFLENHPGRFKAQREEDFAIARGVIHLVRRSALDKRHGALVMQHLAPFIKEGLYPWAFAFVRRLQKDIDRKHSLLKQSADFGDDDE